MPELPEVEAAVRAIRPALVGRRIIGARVRHAALRRTMKPSSVRGLADRRIVAVDRRAKHQLIRLDDGGTLLVHFRMTGDWEVTSRGDVPRFARFTLSLDDGNDVHLVDSRALGAVSLHAGEPPLPALGPEPDSPEFTVEALHDALAKRRIAIKPALMDQRVISGLGNIYAAEALWRAKVSPDVPANSLTRRAERALVRAIRETIERAHRAPGRYSSGESGPLWVYDREGEPCPRCRTAIARIVQAGRSTYYCPKCQPLNREPRAARP